MATKTAGTFGQNIAFKSRLAYKTIEQAKRKPLKIDFRGGVAFKQQTAKKTHHNQFAISPLSWQIYN